MKRETHSRRTPVLLRYFRVLFSHYGPQQWWPGRSRFEIILGALLTQNTAWTNVEKALAALRREGWLNPSRLNRLPLSRLQSCIRPAGTYRQKAKLLRRFLDYFFSEYGGSVNRMFRLPDWHLRPELLRIPGIGPETADSILLYAGDQPQFVVDAYTRRILARHGLIPPEESYDAVQQRFHRQLPRSTLIYNEYHALLVAVGKQFCLRRRPNCEACPLARELPGGGPARL